MKYVSLLLISSFVEIEEINLESTSHENITTSHTDSLPNLLIVNLHSYCELKAHFEIVSFLIEWTGKRNPTNPGRSIWVVINSTRFRTERECGQYPNRHSLLNGWKWFTDKSRHFAHYFWLEAKITSFPVNLNKNHLARGI